MRTRLWLLLSLFVAATAWLYMHRVLGPWEYYVDVNHGRLKAQMGDLYPRWVGTRELLLRGRNPYGPEVSHEIQMAFYGHPIEQEYGRPGQEVLDEQRFVYPVYVVFLLAPTMHADFAQLQIWTPVFLAVLTAASLLLWLKVFRWRPPPALRVALILFVVGSPQVAQGLRLRQLGLLVAFLIAVSAWCVARNHLGTAGAVMAIATIKPQIVILPLAWFLLWGVSDLRRRWPLLAGFGGTLATLIFLGELVLPGWPMFFIQGLAAYRQYFPTTSLLRLALGNVAGVALSVLVVAGLVAFGWQNRKESGGSDSFALTLAAFLVGTTLVLPLLTPFNQVLLILPLLFILRDWQSIPRFGHLLFAAVAGWPWVVSLVLLFVPPQLNSMNRLPLLPSAAVLIVPFILSVLLMLRHREEDAA